VTDNPTNRRAEPRVPVHIEVDCASGDSFLYATITDMSSMGIFIRTDTPLPVGTVLELGFTAPQRPGAEGGPEHPPVRLELPGRVMWNTTDLGRAGMGVRFDHPTPKTRQRLLEIVRAIAYLDVSVDVKP